MIKQRTIKQAVQATGIGLHKGSKVSMTLRPAAAHTGIVFRRTDLEPYADIPANAELVGDTQLCTCLTNAEGVSISTVEHLSSALAGMGIDNILVEVDALRSFEPRVRDDFHDGFWCFFDRWRWDMLGGRWRRWGRGSRGLRRRGRSAGDH